MIGQQPSPAQIIEDLKKLAPAELEQMLRALNLDEMAALSARLTPKERRECGLHHPRSYRAERLRRAYVRDL
jgi:hypothetical protein